MEDTVPQCLPLNEAILKWCDPDLLAAMRKTEAHLQSLFGKRGSEVVIARSFVQVAQKAFLDDVRWRLEIGVILLTGVQTLPELHTVPSPIPGVWATGMEFDFSNRTIACFGHRWIAVTGSLGTLDAAAPGGAQITEAEGPAEGPSEGVGATRRGRESYDDLIMDGLRIHYSQREVPPAPANSWKALAANIRSALEQKYPKRHAENKLPSPETIRTRLPAFYKILLVERAVLK